MPNKALANTIEVMYFALMVGAAGWIAENYFNFSDDDALLREVVITLIAGFIAFALHTLLFSPLRLSVVWHRLDRHEIFEASEIPVRRDASSNAFACHIRLERNSPVAGFYIWVINKIALVPVISIGTADSIQIVAEEQGAVTIPAWGRDYSSVEFSWAARTDEPDLRAAAAVRIYVDNPPKVANGPSAIKYSLQRSHAKPTSNVLLQKFLPCLLGKLTTRSIDVTKVYLDRGA